MPVKVRCGECEHVFAAPDAARGKAVKCPKCEKRVAVPGGAAKPGKAPAKKKAEDAEPQDDHDILANIDLSRVEDTSVKVCPKCGTQVEEDALACEACGTDLVSGGMSAAARRKKALRGGVDPRMFFRVVRKESLAFLKENKNLALRTSLYTIVCTILMCLFFLFAAWCWAMPPRVVGGSLGLLCFLLPLGWIWSLNCEIINATINKKEQMPRVNLDSFGSIALGIKTIVWTCVVGFQTLLMPIGMFLLIKGLPIPGGILVAISGLVLLLISPMVMGHMAMPQTQRGWLLHHQLKCLGKTFGACAYFGVMMFTLSLPMLLVMGGTCAVLRNPLQQFVTAARTNVQLSFDIGAKKAEQKHAASLGKNLPPEGPTIEDMAKTYEPMKWTSIIAPSIMLLLSEFMMGYAAVFMMRANGLLVLYFKKDMKLIAGHKEVVWVAKEKEDEDDPKKKKKGIDGAKAAAGLGGTLVFYIVLNVIVYFATGGKYVILPRWAAVALRIIDAAAPNNAPVDAPGAADAPAAPGIPQPGQAAPAAPMP